jgi:trimeric autotransporter adhesin
VGGAFTTPSHIAKYTTGSWASIGSSGLDGSVYALTMDPWGNLYAGGAFTSAGILGVSHVARWNGSAWQALGMGLNSTVYALVFNHGWLYAGGLFNDAGGVPSYYLARWGAYQTYIPNISR